jgi:LacI family transcriptional regulator
VSDARARQVVDACKNLALSVPDQIAVMGVDDQQTICDHLHPKISSVARDYTTEGYHAALLLHQLMGRTKGRVHDRSTPPLRVVARESTTTFAIPDERLRKVMVYIRNRIESEITIESLCDHASMSRRWLEYSFREILGESPYQYLRRQRLEIAERLLREEPKAKINSVANRAGFSSGKQFAKVFRREFGVSPRDFRQSVECTAGMI